MSRTPEQRHELLTYGSWLFEDPPILGAALSSEMSCLAASFIFALGVSH